MIILDLEMSGLDPQKHSIIDIAAMEFENPENTFEMQCRIDEDSSFDSKSLEYCGFTEESIKDTDKPTVEEVVKKFIEWSNSIEDRTIAGQNVNKDLSFLEAACRKYELEWSFGYRKIDQHSIAYAIMRKQRREIPLDEQKISKLSSDTIMKFVGIPAEPKPHTSALNGVKWQAEALSRLIYGKNLLFLFHSYEVPEYLKK